MSTFNVFFSNFFLTLVSVSVTVSVCVCVCVRVRFCVCCLCPCLCLCPFFVSVLLSVLDVCFLCLFFVSVFWCLFLCLFFVSVFRARFECPLLDVFFKLWIFPLFSVCALSVRFSISFLDFKFFLSSVSALLVSAFRCLLKLNFFCLKCLLS